MNISLQPQLRGLRRKISDNTAVVTIFAVLFVMIAFSSLWSENFRTAGNIYNVLRQVVVLGLVSIGQTFVILTGGIDLSVGSIVKLVSVVSAGTLDGRESLTIPVIALCLLLGSGIGLINGLIITRLRVAPFIVTLGMFSIVRGLALAYTTQPIGEITEPIEFLYNGRIGRFPFAVVFFFVLWGVGVIILGMTPFGRHIYATGDNQQVARLSGVPANRIIVSVFVISGFLAGLAGLMTVSRMGIGDPIVAEGLELDSITAVVLGGTSLFGGVGGLVGTLGGVLVLGMVNNMLNLLRISQWYQLLVKGLIIVGAVAIYKQKE
jgi:ribose/xylose/arabinose/galactoside ABC-type transport system permease subunit